MILFVPSIVIYIAPTLNVNPHLNLPHLSESDTESLNRPLSLIELESSIKIMSKGKSPGLDCIPVEFYLTFWSNLGPLMLDMMQYSIDQGSFPQNMNMAIISLLLKKDKDSTLCSSYRPLSLIGTDVKIPAKVLACRLECFMNNLLIMIKQGLLNLVLLQIICEDYFT